MYTEASKISSNRGQRQHTGMKEGRGREEIGRERRKVTVRKSKSHMTDLVCGLFVVGLTMGVCIKQSTRESSTLEAKINVKISYFHFS